LPRFFFHPRFLQLHWAIPMRQHIDQHHEPNRYDHETYSDHTEDEHESVSDDVQNAAHEFHFHFPFTRRASRLLSHKSVIASRSTKPTANPNTLRKTTVNVSIHILLATFSARVMGTSPSRNFCFE